MTRPNLLVATMLLAVVLAPNATQAHTILKKPFQDRYHFKSVTCYACHFNGKDEQGHRLGKEVLNDLGKELKKLMAEQKLADRLNVARQVDPESKKKVHAEITKEFVETLKRLEQRKAPNGRMWGELIKEGKIDGVKRKSEQELQNDRKTLVPAA